MAYLALVNPAKRRKARKASAGKKRRTRRTSAKRRTNPISLPMRKASRRKAHRVTARRRRNPIAVRGLLGSIVPMVKDAVIGAAGAHAIDYAYGKVSSYLPASMQGGYAGTALKAFVTIVAGRALKKPTRGLSEKAAAGALAVQMYGVVGGLLAQTTAGRVGYASPLPVRNANIRFNPTNRSGVGMITNRPTPTVAGVGRIVPLRTPNVSRAPNTAAM